MSILGNLSTTAISNGDQLLKDNFLPVLTIAPSVLSFGVVSAGFYYNLKFEIKNHETTPIRIKVMCSPLDGEKNNIRVVNLPDIVAPGMVAHIAVELTAEYPGISIFNLRITHNYDSTVYSKLIEANVVSQETFKYVKKSLELQKRPIHRHNVTTLSAIMGYLNENASISTPGTTFSEALIMDDEDMDDLLEYPTCSNVYWDPFEKCLRIDPVLGKVIVDKDIEMEESINRTKEAVNKRSLELEEQGFLTRTTFDRLREDRTNSRNGSPKYFSRPHTSGGEGQSVGEEQSVGLDAMESRASLGDNGSHTSSHSKVLSVASLLAMKRDRIEKQRRMTVNSSNEFAQNSKRDSMVNSMRTLSMIQNKLSQTAPLPSIHN